MKTKTASYRTAASRLADAMNNNESPRRIAALKGHETRAWRSELRDAAPLILAKRAMAEAGR